MGKMTMNFGNKNFEVDDLVSRNTPEELAKFQKKQQEMWNKSERINPNSKPPKPILLKGSGTNEGTDQASAEKNLRQEYENMKADERQKKGRESFDSSPMKKGGKVKKYADGGQIQGQVQQPTYPFYGNTPQAGGQNGGMNQTFNMQPQANADANQQPQQRFKKGGAVKSASARADGCAIRGKTRA